VIKNRRKHVALRAHAQWRIRTSWIQPSFSKARTLLKAHCSLNKKHPVPIEEAAVRAIANNSMAIDIYAWLAYRLHVLTKPTPVSWRALKQQFGISFSRLDNFRVTFSLNLRLALAVYRDAKVEDEPGGLLLYPSRPPVAPRQIGRSA
jgi:Plasmid encoded RepA protein